MARAGRKQEESGRARLDVGALQAPWACRSESEVGMSLWG